MKRNGLRAPAGCALLWSLVLAMALPACAESTEEAPDPAGQAAPAASTEGDAAVEPASFETPPLLQAADVLPAEWMKGEDFQVGPDVENDGLMNLYDLKTTWGELEVVSTPLLRKRLRETWRFGRSSSSASPRSSRRRPRTTGTAPSTEERPSSSTRGRASRTWAPA